MYSPAHPLPARVSSKALVFMSLAWLLIALKCIAVWWAIGHWQVPVHPMWIVAPTVACAALATSLWLTHRSD